MKRAICIGAVLAAIATTPVTAMPIDPTIGTEGDLADFGTNVTFSGSGIPTSPANYGTFTDIAGNELLLGILATRRYSAAPTPVSDSDGTYSVQPGLAAAGSDPTPRALWNFSFYAELFPATGTGLLLENIGLKLFYDLDPTAATDRDDMGIIDLSGLLTGTGGNIVQASQNATFGYLTTGDPGVTAPTVSAFNANGGEYSFLLAASSFTTAAATGIGMNVAPVPVPATFGMLLAGLAAFAFVGRRRRVAV
ncbi:VPLPA-CTERM sorting domain-containing protein [Roseisalinus antarcticus]|uniref:Ice-binding protein C-terminal domain-containing protein n=1 Tax=Roseisalinus antarcticus TaxID=254357 RepID=A0A1Y5RNZ6_9RHOB|nr:VPLPA-CTERM sorting domain-containing protein [Roseisalinus antarcticus]SLN21958.1 hypothetical protein ROA7023_00604 [Roseisalinus antarcticus]